MPKTQKIFYGWWIVGAVFLITAYSSGIIFYGFTAILEPIVNEFGWTYAQVSFAASLRGLETGLIAPVVGFLIDRFGPRKLIFAGAFVIGLGLLLFSRVTSLWMFYSVFIMISLGMSTCSGVVTMTAVGNWFRRRVTTANSIATCGTAFGGLLVPLVVKSIEVFDWRTTMGILGLGTFIIVLPLSLLVRHRPEQYGYLPDGDKIVEIVQDEGPAPRHAPRVKTIISQAMRSRIFWKISIGLTCHVLTTAAVVTHIMPYLGSIDVSRTESSLAAGGIALAGMMGRLGFGWLGDRHDQRIIVSIAFGVTITGLLLLTFIADAGRWLVLPAAVIFGLGFGGPVPMVATLILKYFGRNKLGPILGLNLGVVMLGSMIGPPSAGWFFDTFHCYQYAWIAFSVIIGIGMISMLSIPSVNTLTDTVHIKKHG